MKAVRYTCIMVQASKRRPTSPRTAAKLQRPIDRLLDAPFFQALSDPTRLQLLACLAKCGRPCSVSEVAECCAVDLSVVSRHLAALERSGVLKADKRGRSVAYHVRFAALAARLRALADAIESCCPAGGDCCSRAETAHG